MLAAAVVGFLVTMSGQPVQGASAQRSGASIPRLVVHKSRGIAGEPLPLGVTMQGRTDGAVVIITGLIPGMSLSSGSPAGANIWQVPATDLANTWVGPPLDFVGTVDLVAELHLDGATIIPRQPIRIEWIATSAAVGAQVPATSPQPEAIPAPQQLEQDEIAMEGNKNATARAGQHGEGTHQARGEQRNHSDDQKKPVRASARRRAPDATAYPDQQQDVQQPSQPMQTRDDFALLPGAMGAMAYGAAAEKTGTLDRGERQALLIANADYPDVDAALRQPLNDARALADELRRSGFEVRVEENLVKQAMLNAIADFKARINQGSTALVFFSGYGIQVSQQNYVIPVNAQIWSEGDVLRDGIAIESVLADLDRAGARVKLVMLDASWPNPFERRFRGSSLGLASLTASQGTLIIYSAAPGNVTADSDGDNSLFVSEFLKELRSRRSTAERVFMSTARGVSRASDGKQVPWVSSSLSEDFYFRQSLFPKPLREVPGATATARPADNAEQPHDKTGCRRAAWRSTKQASSEAPARLTAGRCAELAPSGLVRLDSAPPPTSEYRLAGESATLDLDEAIKRHPDVTEAHFLRGRIYVRRGDYRRAISDFDQVIRLDPKDAEALNDRCWVRAILNRLRAALRDCNKALALQPTFADAFDSLAFVHLKMRKRRRAISFYDAALRGSPNKATSLFGRGKAKLKIGDRSGGAEDINAAQVLKPNISKEFASYGVR
jgi:hypothetical protein